MSAGEADAYYFDRVQIRKGSWVCNRARLAELKQQHWKGQDTALAYIGPLDPPKPSDHTWYTFYMQPLVLSEYAPDGGPYWVPVGQDLINTPRLTELAALEVRPWTT